MTVTTEYSARNATEALDLVLQLHWVRPSSLNPRKHFDEAKLEELAASIRQHGLLEPLVVRETRDASPAHPMATFEIVAGERRYRACLLAGLTEVPVRNLGAIDDRTALELALIENLQRVDLDPIEEAEGYRQLNRVVGKTQVEIATAVNRSQPAVANAMRLLELPEDVQGLIRAGNLSVSHGVALVRWKQWPEFVSGAAAKVVTDSITSKELESMKIDDYRLSGTRLLFYNAPFSATCAECPLGMVWEPSGNTSVYSRFCMKPSHYQQLQREHEQAAKRANAALVAEIKEKPGEVEIPTFQRFLERGNVEQLDARRTPKGCTADCPCRAKARQSSGSVIAVCLDPKRLEKLRNAETRAANQEKRDRHIAKGGKVLAAAADERTPRTLLLALIVGKALGGHSNEKTKRVQTILDSLHISVKAEHLLSYGGGPDMPYGGLVGLTEDELLRLGAMVVLREEVWAEFESYGSGMVADWFLRLARQLRIEDECASEAAADVAATD